MQGSILDNIRKLLHNPHFWGITLILTFLFLLYYYLTIPYNDYLTWLRPLAYFEFSNRMTGTLFIVPFTYAALFLGWQGTLTVWILSIIIISKRMLWLSFDVGSFIQNLFYASLPLITVLSIVIVMRWKNRLQTVTSERLAEREVYLAKIFQAQEDERKRISQELHDDTTQTLLAVANRAHELVANGVNNDIPQVIKASQWIRDTIVRVAEDVRRLSLDLRPSILDNAGLLSALRWLTESLQNESGIETKITIDGEAQRFKPDYEVLIFRIVQEALNNIRRHSRAKKVIVQIQLGGESLDINVQDDGIGFDAESTGPNLTATGTLGLIGMKERVNFLKGTLAFHSRVGKGTSVLICIPNPYYHIQNHTSTDIR